MAREQIGMSFDDAMVALDCMLLSHCEAGITGTEYSLWLQIQRRICALEDEVHDLQEAAALREEAIEEAISNLQSSLSEPPDQRVELEDIPTIIKA